MNGIFCECCKRSEGTLILESPTDASAPRGTIYCDRCSMATCAGFEPIEKAPAILHDVISYCEENRFSESGAHLEGLRAKLADLETGAR